VDPKFRPAIAAIKAGDLDQLISLVKQDPSLASGRSQCSHPTLLQCLALDAVDVPNKVEMAQVLIDAGAEIDEPLVAAASIGNVEVAALLLDRGGAINGRGDWSPLEEALYWNNQRVVELLLERGATVHNLRLAAGLGRLDLIESFFNGDGSLKPAAGKIAWPFREPEKSNLNEKIKQELLNKISNWSHDRQSILDNAFIYACMHNQVEAARLLLQQGADVNAIAPGFDYSGTGLHNAAINGHRAMVEFLIEQGADVNIKDTKVGATPAGWADYCGHAGLRDYLEQIARRGTE
jgi:ankyrin repeat protein